MKTTAALAALLLALAFAACGGGQGGGDGGSTAADIAPPARHGSAAAARFTTKGGDNSIQESGSEGSRAELAAAAPVLRGYLNARAAGHWGLACSQMAPGTAASLTQLGGGKGGRAGCPRALASLSAGIPPTALREAAVAEVGHGALREEGDRAFLLFRGAHGADYFMPMVREDGAWKVAALAPSPLS